MTDPRSGLKTPERFDAGTDSLTTCCPVCGCLIDGLAADDRTTIEPCGHSARGLTTTSMNPDTTSDANRVMTDGGQTQDEYVLAVYQTYEDGANLETAPDGTIENHDELVEAGQTYREIRLLNRETVERFDVRTVEPGDDLYDDSLDDLGRGEAVRISDLRGESDD